MKENGADFYFVVNVQNGRRFIIIGGFYATGQEHLPK
jgi:hypothetical protein